jgi:hypothetical protein
MNTGNIGPSYTNRFRDVHEHWKPDVVRSLYMVQVCFLDTDKKYVALHHDVE